MSFLTLFLAAAIAAGISYALHVIDRENNSLEKVKRYADKRLSEADEYFQKQTKNLTSCTANLETKYMQATAAVKRLESQIEEFRKMTENLSSDSKAIEELERKIDSYDKVINELVDMTTNVEKNLDEVKKESLVIDTVQGKISEQKKFLDSLEKRIPQVTADFSEKNKEHLKLIANKLLSEYDNHGEQIKKDLLTIENKAKQTMADFQREINEVYEDASDRKSTRLNSSHS